ncbi:retrovirus-related pol polyprotein from transposon TNT 1-94 [Tanacetum coccineum]
MLGDPPGTYSLQRTTYFQAEKEAIFLILTGIGDEIYSTVDACNTAKEMWTAIERLQQGESLNVQDVKTNLFWEFGKFTSRDGESMESYYSRFYKLMNELTRNNLQVSPMQVNVQFLQQLQPEWSRFVTIVKQRQEIDKVSYHKLFDVLKQFQNEVNDIRSERLARSANPLALLAAAQPYSDNYYQAPKPQRSNAPSYMQSSSTRPSASTRHKGKEIAKPVTPQSESVSEEDSDPEQARRDKDMKKNLALLAKYFKKLYKPTNNNLRTSSNSRNKTEDTTPRYNNDSQSRQFGNQRTVTVAGARETVGSPVVQKTGIQCFNCKGFGHYARECRKPKRVKDYAYHKEKMMMCKQAEQGVPLQAEQADWLEDTDEEIDEQELEAHYSYMAKIQEVSPEESSSTGQPLEQVQNHDENDVFANVDQNAAECVDERAALANLIANLTLDTEENKTILKQLKKANASELKNVKECKTNLDESSRALGEATSSRDSSLIVLQTKQTELEKYTALNDLTNKTILDSHCFIHELKKEMNDDLEYVNSLEKELDELESEKADFSNIYDLLLEECVSKDVICSYLHSLSDLNAHTGLQCLYLHKVKECECLALKLSKQTESVNKEVHNNLLKSFAKLEKHSISLELSLQHCKEQMKNNPVCKENASNVFRKEREQYHEIQDLKAQMQDKNMVINELKKLILVTKGKSVETQFDKPSVVRQPNAQRIPKPSVLGKPTPFSNSPEMRSFQTKQSVNKTNVSDGLFKPVTQQSLPQNRNQAVRNTNVLKPGMFRIASTTTQTRTPQLPHASRNTNPHMSKSSGVIHTTSVSRPQLKCYQVKDKVVPNNSQVKFQKKEVEDHHRISSISKKTKSVTACNDSSNSRTSNANAVCAECGKCVFNSNHDACVSRYLKDVNARTKKPNVVPISASKPKRKANKSVATPHKKTVASDTTIQKSKSYYKKLYENTNQEWKWWIAKRCPSGYTWTQKPLRTKKIWMPKIRKADESTSISPTIDIVSRITNVLKISNSLGSNLSNVPSSSNSLADCTTSYYSLLTHGCTKHMTGNLKLCVILWRKYLGTVQFGNDPVCSNSCYGDLIQGMSRSNGLLLEGLNHNLFPPLGWSNSVMRLWRLLSEIYMFCERSQGNDLLTGNALDLISTTISLSRNYSQLQSVFIHMAKASHQLNFGYGIEGFLIRNFDLHHLTLKERSLIKEVHSRQKQIPSFPKGRAKFASHGLWVPMRAVEFPQGQKASDNDHSDPVPPAQMLFLQSAKDRSSHQRKREIDFEETFAPVGFAWKQFVDFNRCPQAAPKSFPL